jgi:2,3-dihydroxybenzoate decarboxylase
VKKIGLEEHFLIPGFEEYWLPTVGGIDRNVCDQLLARLRDFGDLRISAMDRAGIERSVLSLSGPGVQAERDSLIACRKAREANDLLALQVQKRPKRYAGFAHLPMQDPRAAALEFERCALNLGFCGAMINGHTNGRYLDEPAFYPFWERVEAIGLPIYLHPADPVTTYPAIAGCDALKRAMWEWGVETGSHALRLVLGGVFDRFPKLTLILGHLGETLPYLLWRFDSRARIYGLKLQKSPSEYIRQNFRVTTSGMFSADPLLCCIGALGAGNVMFSVDYPFESTEEAGQFIETAPLHHGMRMDICFRNAERALGLTDG